MSKKLKLILVILLITIITIIFTNNTKVFKETKSGEYEEKNISYEINNTRGTIVNVPIDSRPISNSNFEKLVKAAGYNYVSISEGLDSMDSNETYIPGNPEETMEELSIAMSNRPDLNSEDTTIIINLSSYFLGGLVPTADYEAYENMDTKIAELKSIMTSYTKPTYYIILQIPRTLPDSRVLEFPISKEIDSEGTILTNTTKVKSLVDYYNEYTGGTEIGNREFQQACIQWGYFRYYKKINGEFSYNLLPEYVQNFCEEFYTKYGDFLEKYNESFEYTKEYANAILDIKKEITTESNFILGINDDELAYFFSHHKSDIGTDDFNYLEKDEKGNIVKYGPAYYLEKIFKNEDLTIIPGADEIHHMILARDLVAKTKIGVEFTYIDPVTNDSVSEEKMNELGAYDTITVQENLIVREKFVNGDTIIEKNVPLDTFLVNFTGDDDLSTEDSQIAVNNIYNNSNKKVVIDVCGNDGFDKELLSALVSEGNIFDLNYCSSWNTVGNSLGIGLASAIVNVVLETEIENNMLTDTLKERLFNYMKYKVITVLEGCVYNTYKEPPSGSEYSTYTEENAANTTGEVLANRISYVGGDGGAAGGASLIEELLYDNTASQYKYKIGDISYTVDGIDVTAVRPWYRKFEVEITPNISGLTYYYNYVVEHYKQNVDGTYPEEPHDSYTYETIPGTKVTTNIIVYEGYKNPTKQTVEITENGQVIKYYYERIHYTINYDGNGATSGTTESSTHTYDVSQNLTKNGFEKTGYTFTGWNTCADGSGKTCANETEVNNWTTEDGATITLYAQWTINSYDLTINYVYEDGSEAIEQYKQTIEYNKEYSVSSPEISGYTADKTVVKGIMGAENTTIIVTYKANTNTSYKVEHYKQNLEDVRYTLVDTDELTGTTGETTDAKSKDYEGFTVQGISQVQIQGNGSTVVKIFYTRNTYELVYNANGGIVVPESTIVKYGTEITLPTPTKEEYTFEGWYIDEMLETVVTLTDGKYTLKGNVTLYAKWTEIYLKSTITEQKIDETNLKITGIQANMTVAKLKETFQSNILFEILDSNGNSLEDTSIVGTGYKVKLENGKIYTLSVWGDLNGDGQIRLSDLSKMKMNLVGKQQLEGVYKDSADLNGDGDIKLSDLSELKLYLVSY